MRRWLAAAVLVATVSIARQVPAEPLPPLPIPTQSEMDGMFAGVTVLYVGLSMIPTSITLAADSVAVARRERPGTGWLVASYVFGVPCAAVGALYVAGGAESRHAPSLAVGTLGLALGVTTVALAITGHTLPRPASPPVAVGLFPVSGGGMLAVSRSF